MGTALVVGAGPVGLGAAMLLAQRGLRAVVVDRDAQPAPPDPDGAWQAWQRRGVAQFHQAHLLLAGGFRVLDEHLPSVVEALVADGGLRYDFAAHRPPQLQGWQDRDGDARFTTVNARRPVLELAFAQAAAATPGVEVHRGTTVSSLLVGTPAIAGVPHIVGATTTDGRELRADVVVEVSGRGSAVTDRLGQAGAHIPEADLEADSFAYYTRYYRSDDGTVPEVRAPLLSPLGSISVLTLPCDNGTWSVTVYGLASDHAVRAVRDPVVFERVVRACPLHAHWLDGKPLGGVQAMASVLGRRRRFRSGSTPIATGLVAVGDAWAYTNPSLGRGISLGLRHALRTADLLAADPDPVSLAEGWLATTEGELGAWYDATLAVDRLRLAEMAAARAGIDPPFDPGDRMQATSRALAVASQLDPEVFRAYLELVTCLAPASEVLARPGLVDRILAVAGSDAPPPLPGPDRAGLLALLSQRSTVATS